MRPCTGSWWQAVGRVFPSLEGLAYLAMCCKQSVVTALADLERLGFVTRIRRIRQVQTSAFSPSVKPRRGPDP
jgi:hypothetical protein